MIRIDVQYIISVSWSCSHDGFPIIQIVLVGSRSSYVSQFVLDNRTSYVNSFRKFTQLMEMIMTMIYFPIFTYYLQIRDLQIRYKYFKCK